MSYVVVMKSALVTGANRGLGRSVSDALRAQGWRVVATSRDGSTGTALDLARAESIDALANTLLDVRARGEAPLDLLLHNAAIYDGALHDVLRTNFEGPRRLTRALLPVLSEGARVVMVSSGMGALSGVRRELRRTLLDDALTEDALVALVDALRDGRAAGMWPSNAYSASKVALNALTRVLARELAPRGIAVHAVCPGWVRTDMGGPSAPRSIEQGTRSILATALGHDDGTGRFFRDGAPIAW